MQLEGMYGCAEDDTGIYIEEFEGNPGYGQYMVIKGDDEDSEFADTGSFEAADVIGIHEKAHKMISEEKESSRIIQATGMIHDSRKCELAVTLISEDGTEATKTYKKQY